MNLEVNDHALVIGGGPAGLMAAELISRAGLRVDLYEAKPSPGRKFLVAGKGGLNLTHSEDFENFAARYGDRQAQIEPLLRAFGPDQLRTWARELGHETFVGSTGRVFPTGMKAAPLLRTWLVRLKENGVRMHTRHRWQGWDDRGRLVFMTRNGEIQLPPAPTVLALGGGSWPQLGSDAGWVPILEGRGVKIAPLRPSNCGFEVGWGRHFRERYSGVPVKSVALNFCDSTGKVFSEQGEFVITSYGVEGSLVYAASALIRDEIERSGPVNIFLDLVPGRSEEQLRARLANRRPGESLSNRLRKAAGIRGVKGGLLRESSPRETGADPEQLARALKRLPVLLKAPRPLAEAISTAGGVSFEALNEQLMIRELPGVFCAGEMLDWEAPTGGYLLTACFASGYIAGKGLVDYVVE